MYAVCVIWPFKLNPTVGGVIGGLVALSILLQYIVGLIKRLKPSPGSLIHDFVVTSKLDDHDEKRSRGQR